MERYSQSNCLVPGLSRAGAGSPRSQLALEGRLHRQRKSSSKLLLLLTTRISCAKRPPHRQGVQQAKKAIGKMSHTQR